MKAEIKEGKLQIDIQEILENLSDWSKGKLLELFVFDEIVEQIERQLKSETSCWGYDTTGYRHGSRLREYILKIQGIETEFKKDMESRIRVLEGDVKNYKRYYDWYFKIYHHGKNTEESNELFERVIRCVGDVREE